MREAFPAGSGRGRGRGRGDSYRQHDAYDGPEEGHKPSRVTLDNPSVDRTRVVPVPEADSVPRRPTSGGNHDGQDDQSRQHGELERGEGEFGLSGVPHGQIVQADDDDEEDGDEDGVVDGGAPVLDDEGGDGDLEGHKDRIRIPVVPAQGKAKGLGKEASCEVVGRGAIQRDEGSHFEEKSREDPDDGADGEEGEEGEGRAASAEGFPRADEKGGSDASC